MATDQRLSMEYGGLADSIAKQLRAQGIHIPGHATASLERTRRALWQLGATRIISRREHERAERRFGRLIAKTIFEYKGYEPSHD